ncbi:hypothetical protein [uncultured Dokdonia sp.]|uniref:hypothetical protein n=1 Tax=uncultured Dokdonia sp. TaxID=575653 RepID=UPI002620E51E|nr:hypothetical protein [uncultured Dokdonia sp.]
MIRSDTTLNQIVTFLESIDILVLEKELPDETFLPGLHLYGNTIQVDFKKLKYPGDLLHEAGHIATTEKELRPLIGTKEMDPAWPSDGDEIATILWSYAAATHLSIDLTILFHAGGYKNDSEWLIEQFTNKNYVGLPLLEWMELCDSKEFPIMNKWLR